MKYITHGRMTCDCITAQMKLLKNISRESTDLIREIGKEKLIKMAKEQSLII